MYGGIYAFQGEYDNPYYQGSIHKLNPLAEAFDEVYFENMVRGLKKDVSAKALLATEQRIPGLGNGVVQDILYNAGIHPRRKVSTLGDLEKSDLLYSMKGTLANMVELGGRDTEKDFSGIGEVIRLFYLRIHTKSRVRIADMRLSGRLIWEERYTIVRFASLWN